MTLIVLSYLHWVPRQPEIPPVTFKQSPHGGGAEEEVWAERVEMESAFHTLASLF